MHSKGDENENLLHANLVDRNTMSANIFPEYQDQVKKERDIVRKERASSVWEQLALNHKEKYVRLFKYSQPPTASKSRLGGNNLSHSIEGNNKGRTDKKL